MNKIELFKMALTNLFRRKTRSILAILGVLIGTSSIITMVSIGLGISKSFNDDMKKNAAIHMIEIYGVGRANGDNTGKTVKMDQKAVDAIKKVSGVTSVTPVKELNANMVIGNYSGNINIKGMDTEFLEKVIPKLSKGRMLSANDKYKILIGKSIPMMLQNYRTGQYVDYVPDGNYKMELLSKKVEITSDTKYKQHKKGNMNMNNVVDDETKNVKYEVFKFESVGIIDSESEYGYSVYTNLETMKLMEKSNLKAESDAGTRKTLGNNQDFNSIWVYIDDINYISGVLDKLKSDGYQFYSIMDSVKEEQKRFAMIQGALGGIGGISLLVAAIGITNTMIMSIYERTKEIGVMKVIGASLKDIKSLFLYEAAFIGLIGGIVGTIISIGLSFAINYFYAKYSGSGTMMSGGMMTNEQTKAYISYIPIWLGIFGVLFSTLIGVISGYIPAKKAMSLSALESLRNE